MSDGVGSLSMDDSYNRKREELRAGQSGQSVDHLLAGVKGFGYGVFGGLTSLISQTISGTRKRGLEVRNRSTLINSSLCTVINGSLCDMCFFLVLLAAFPWKQYG